MKHDHHEFDDYAKNYRDNLDKNLAISGESSTFFAEYKARKLGEWFPKKISKPLAVLDFGCGDGLMTSFVKQIFSKSQVHGCDPSSESIKLAQDMYEDIAFAVSGAKLDYDDNTFDIIFAAGAFHHIPFHEHKSYMQEINRVLKPNGRFVLFELNPLNPATVWIFKHNPIDFNAKMMLPWYSRKLLKPYGNINIKFYSFFPAFLGKLRFLEPYMTKVPFGALYAYILKSKKK